MAVTTMEQITSLTQRLLVDSLRCPHLDGMSFESADSFGWDAAKKVISYDPYDDNAAAYLLHEYGHALLGHDDYSHDVTLLTMERAAWDQALPLAERYDVPIDSELIESALDTYRDWLHARSACPDCGATGIQTAKRCYLCIACHHTWRVNDARSCALRRYHTKNNP